MIPLRASHSHLNSKNDTCGIASSSEENPIFSVYQIMHTESTTKRHWHCAVVSSTSIAESYFQNKTNRTGLWEAPLCIAASAFVRSYLNMSSLNRTSLLLMWSSLVVTFHLMPYTEDRFEVACLTDLGKHHKLFLFRLFRTVENTTSKGNLTDLC